MRFFFLKGLLILVTVTMGAVYAYAVTEIEKSPSKAVVVSQPAVAGQTAKPATAKKPAVSGKTDKKSSAQSKPVETIKIRADVLPAQVAAVSGDYHKYEAMNWQNRGYSGGIDDLSIRYTSGDDVTIDVGGGGIMGNGDYKGSYSIAKKDVGYMDIDFKQFRKYYDTYGGVYKGWSQSLSRDLFLDIGDFSIEAGITMPDYPNVSVYYEHDYKDGEKSTLNWASVFTGAVAVGEERKIAPSWTEIDESVDTFGIKADYTEKGYHFSGDQRWEIAKTKTLNYEQPTSMITGNGGQANVEQYFTTDTTLMTTMLGADKWYLNDKVFASSAYRFEHLKNNQVQRILSFTNGVLSAATAPDGDAHNAQDVNSWVLNLMASPWSWLSGTGGFKAEVSQRNASSYYPAGTSSSILRSGANSDTYKLAETFGLRFKAIPRTAIYSDLSFEQSQNHLRVGRDQADPATAYSKVSRDAIIDEPVITWAAGADFQPVRFLNLTSQFRLRDKSMNLHDVTDRATPFAGQVFMEKLNTHTLGFTQRATVYLSGWAQTSFRYLYDNTDYDSRATLEIMDSKARMLSNTFIYDISVFPTSNLSMTGSLSQQLAETKTVSASTPFATLPVIPTFTSNYYTWMFTTDYQPHEKVSVDGSLFYTFTNNDGNGQSPDLVNYASAYDQLGLAVSCKWKVRKDLTVEPQYGYQRYQPNEKSGIGGAYDAQIFSVALTSDWG